MSKKFKLNIPASNRAWLLFRYFEEILWHFHHSAREQIDKNRAKNLKFFQWNRVGWIEICSAGHSRKDFCKPQLLQFAEVQFVCVCISCFIVCVSRLRFISPNFRKCKHRVFGFFGIAIKRRFQWSQARSDKAVRKYRQVCCNIPNMHMLLLSREALEK